MPPEGILNQLTVFVGEIGVAEDVDHVVVLVHGERDHEHHDGKLGEGGGELTARWG